MRKKGAGKKENIDAIGEDYGGRERGGPAKNEGKDRLESKGRVV